jgi:hypothetical protein
METRWGARNPLNLRVRVEFPQHGMCRGRVRNYSISGMYVEVDGQRSQVPLYARVVIVYTIKDGAAHRLQRLEAHVVRKDTTGLGLMLGEINTGTWLRLARAGSANHLQNASDRGNDAARSQSRGRVPR